MNFQIYLPLLLSFQIQFAFALGNPDSGKVIAAQGTASGVAACATCHGEKGEGQAATGFPQLSGLNSDYLYKQLMDYKKQLRINPIMNAMAKSLSENEMQDVAAYYSSLQAQEISATAKSENLIEAGQRIASTGLWEKEVPACFSCHGPNGAGVGASFPRIQNQHRAYILQQLKAWKSNQRRNDPNGLMKTIAQKLTPKEMEAVAAFLSSPVQAQSQIQASPQKDDSSKKAKQAKSKKLKFTPPDEKDIPNDEFGKLVRKGRDIFVHTQDNAKDYIGNSLNCVNCHLNQGRLENSSPLWAAYVLYPAFRKKTGKVDTLQERLQGCFKYSMNGKAPAADSEVMTALVTYMYWLAKGAPTGVELQGRGYPELSPAKTPPSFEAGEKVYLKNCAVCHGAEGQGQFANSQTVFPPLWGERSYNWGAGMHRVNTAAAFIKANMPLSLGGSLTEQEAWDVAYYINAHERPRDPRMKSSLEETKKQYHDENCLYGETVNGHKLGVGSAGN